jgi:hypothetical protein
VLDHVSNNQRLDEHESTAEHFASRLEVFAEGFAGGAQGIRDVEP